jgi:hypothetical protein
MSEEKDSHEKIKYLVGQLQNCINHLEHAKRRTVSGNYSYDVAIDSANRAIYNVTKGDTPHRELK